jgi:hypothetical protein
MEKAKRSFLESLMFFLILGCSSCYFGYYEEDDPTGTENYRCDGACQRYEYNICTCNIHDPCGWSHNSRCDLNCYDHNSNPFEDYSDCDNDLDIDYVDDVEEFDLARSFAPNLVFSSEEVFGAYFPNWAVRMVSENEASIIYALGYYADGGDMETGLTEHLGDPEFIVVDVEYDSGFWEPVEIFLSAHYNNAEIWDYSGWYDSDEFAWNTQGGNAHPIVWVANWKHANYPDRNSCDDGAMWFDWCDEGWREIVEVRESGNLGSREYPLQDQVVFNGGNVEYYWSNPNLPFCGWQVHTESATDRSDWGCGVTSYAEIMETWSRGTL